MGATCLLHSQWEYAIPSRIVGHSEINLRPICRVPRTSLAHLLSHDFPFDSILTNSHNKTEYLTTRQAAKKLGLLTRTLSRYVQAKKIPSPKVIKVGGFVVHSWTEAEIEHVRQLLPKIANGRKTRYSQTP